MIPSSSLALAAQGQGQGFLSCGVLAQQGPQGDAVGVGAPRQGGTGRHAGLPRPPPRDCPRCRSGNTKFCYYNNYSRKQPRYLCRACRRHWTEGGTLRDVPVGGGRKSRRNNGAGSRKAAATKASASPSTADAAAAAGVDGSLVVPADVLRQMLFFQPAGFEGGYGIDMGAWQQQQMAAAAPNATKAPQGVGGEVGAGVEGTSASAADGVNCGAGMQFWSGGWQQMQDDMPGFDGTF